MNRPSRMLFGCCLSLVLLYAMSLSSEASPSQAAIPTAAINGTWRSFTCGDCYGRMAVGRDGLVWGGTPSGGVTRWDPATGNFRRFTDVAGLPGNWVSELVVDAQNRPWVALRQSHYPKVWGWLGVSTFDGTRWTTYDTTNGLPSNTVLGLAADGGGQVWVATDAGLADFDGGRWSVATTTDGLPSNVVLEVAVSADGTVWAATDAGLARLQLGTWAQFPQPGTPQILVADPWGQVWLAWGDGTGVAGGLSRFDGTSWTKFDLGGTVSSMALGAGPRIWAAVYTSPRSLQSFNGTQWSVTPAPDLGATGSGVSVTASPTGPDVYVGRVIEGGLQRFDGSRWSTAQNHDGPATLITMSVALGPADSVAVGQFSSGRRFGFVSLNGGNWQAHRGEEQTQSVAFNMPVTVDRTGTVWLASYRSGLARFASGQWEYFSTVNGLPSMLVRALATDAAGRLWVGTEDAGAALYNGSSWRRFTTADGLASQDVRSALVDRAGHVWLGTANAGLSRYDGARWRTFTVADGLGGLDVFELAEGRDGQLWAGGRGWVARYDGSTWQQLATPFTTTDRASFVALTVAPDGALWAAETDSEGGVARYDGSAWQTFTSADGLLSDVVYDLVADSRGTVWAATLIGVASFTPDAVAVPTPTPSLPTGPCICQLARRELPGAVLNDALANPARYDGWQQPLDPGKPVSPYNPPRTCLTLRNPNVAFHPTFNGPVWRVGCP